jgi:hypothetical protein
MAKLLKKQLNFDKKTGSLVLILMEILFFAIFSTLKILKGSIEPL